MLSGGTQRRAFALTPERRSENINVNINKYLISSNRDRTHNQSILQAQFVLLRHDCHDERYYCHKLLNVLLYIIDLIKSPAEFLSPLLLRSEE